MVTDLESFKKKIQSQAIPIIEILGKAEDAKERIAYIKPDIEICEEDQATNAKKTSAEYNDKKNTNFSHKQTAIIQVLFAINESGSLLVEETQFKTLFDPENEHNIFFLLKESSFVENIEIALSQIQLNKENAVAILKPNRLPKDSALVILKDQ